MNTPASPPKTARRWLRLSVRGLLLLVLASGGGLGWFELRARSQRESVAAIKAAGARVEYDLDTDDEGVPTRPWTRWLVDHLGIDRVSSVVEVYSGSRLDDAGMAAVSRLASLRKLDIVECPVTDAAVADGLGGLWRLESLQLYGDDGGPKLTHAIIPAVAGLGRLEELHLGIATMRLDDSDLDGLSRLSRLRVVTLGGPEVTDRGLASLARLPLLESLHLEGTAVTEVGLGHLARCKTLGHLDLDGSKATTLEPLRDLPNLTHLLVSDGPLASLWKSPVTGLGRLETLILRRMTLTDDGLAHLDGLPGLNFLLLNKAGLTDAGLAHVGRCTGLVGLDVSGDAVTTLEPIRNLHRLKTLDVSNTAITTLDPVRDMPRLEKLDAQNCPIAVAWKTPPTGLDSLWYMNLSGTTIAGEGLARMVDLPAVSMIFASDSGIDDAGLAYLGGMKALTYLHIDSIAITDAGLAGLTRLANLTDLDLSNTAIGDASVPHLLAIPGSPSLTLMRTRLTDAGLLRLIEGGFRGKLHLGGQTLSDKGVQAARSANPKLEITVQYGDEPR